MAPKIPKRRVKKDPQEIVEELRLRLAPKDYLGDNKLESDSFLLRYLRYHGMNVKNAKKSIKKYYKYTETKEESRKVEAPSHYVDLYQVFGFSRDSKNRPVVQIPNLKAWDITREVDEMEEDFIKSLVKKMFWYLEEELFKNHDEAVVILVDLKDCLHGETQINPHRISMAMELAGELTAVAPGVIGECILLNAPDGVKLVTVAAEFLFKTHCTLITDEDDDWREQLMEIIPEDQLRPEFGGTFIGEQILH
ncbi:unnamed protein product [Allacma fusca]|uniref:CRAL-TRIO domain-containing protein n=1 Tax=Allacma fusca TaxID=39272 RepID=A0A8J2JTZ2_9HEXA|nr:unnamed protein product [Allacma fusca]